MPTIIQSIITGTLSRTVQLMPRQLPFSLGAKAISTYTVKVGIVLRLWGTIPIE